jgi:signal transduction histidine kinase
VAHEINNPLAYVGNNLAVLERDLKGILAIMAAYESGRPALESHAPEVIKQVDELNEDLDWEYVRANLERMISRTRDGVQRVASIVQNLRGLARTSTLKLEPALLRDLIAPAVEMIQGRGKRHNIEIVIDIPANLRVNCVTSQISQVLLNLLVNAIQAPESVNRPAGGKITVTSVTRGDMVGLKIQDTGCGIPGENLPKLFDPFFTTKAVGEGTGLGLSISHGIITGHGGRIEVESESGVGTAFTVFLPMNGLTDSRKTTDPNSGATPEKV